MSPHFIAFAMVMYCLFQHFQHIQHLQHGANASAYTLGELRVRLEACDATVEAYTSVVEAQGATLRDMQRDIQMLKSGLQQQQRIQQRAKRPAPKKKSRGR